MPFSSTNWMNGPKAFGAIRTLAKNGAVVLSGSVKTEAQKREAERLAKHVPNVQQVVNEIEVKPGKHSTAS